MGVSSEMDTDDARKPDAREPEGETGTIVVDGTQVLAMRRSIHELANVLTGVMISGGLLAQYLHPIRPEPVSHGSHQGTALWHYADGVCEGCERGCALLRELRSQLLYACGEAPAGALGSAAGGEKPDMESFKKH
jgi:hypothetical protein